MRRTVAQCGLECFSKLVMRQNFIGRRVAFKLNLHFAYFADKFPFGVDR